MSARFCSNTGNAIEPNLHKSNGNSPQPTHGLVGRVLDGRYRVIRQIGAGGMGVVFEAEDLARRILVAVKVVATQGSREAQMRLAFEARMAAAVPHINLCATQDVGWLGQGAPYLVFERLNGETLAQRLKAGRWLSVQFTSYVFAQILDGLQAAHAARVVHRDLKPENIFLASYPTHGLVPKILDFGLARDLSAPTSRLTQPGRACGTVLYMSPEQLLGQQVGPRSDLFAVGVMMYESLTGRHPFDAGPRGELKLNILQTQPKPISHRRSDVPAALEALIFSAIAKEPADRPVSAGQMARWLSHATSGFLDQMDENQPASGRERLWPSATSVPSS